MKPEQMKLTLDSSKQFTLRGIVGHFSAFLKAMKALGIKDFEVNNLHYEWDGQTITPGSIIRAKQPFRVFMGYGPNRDGLCGVGELFLVGSDSGDDELELWPLNELLEANLYGRHQLPGRTYHDPKELIPEFAELLWRAPEAES